MPSPSRVLKLIALLLDYPSPDVRAESLALHALIRTAELPEARRDGLAALLDALCQGDLLDVQERYDSLFERGRALSLLLFEHVHGESRDRGQAMVDLLERYSAAGLAIDANELPDYLPLYLEFLALGDAEAARQGLVEVAHILALLAQRLAQRESLYAQAFEALLALAGVAPELAGQCYQAQQEAVDDSLEALDRAWEETPVSFTEPAAGCPSASPRRQPAGVEQPLQWVAQPVPQTHPRATR